MPLEGFTNPALSGIAFDAAVVVTSDSQDVSSGPDALDVVAFRVGGAGDVRVTTRMGSTLTLSGLGAGEYVPLAVSRIWATGTTATNIVAFLV